MTSLLAFFLLLAAESVSLDVSRNSVGVLISDPYTTGTYTLSAGDLTTTRTVQRTSTGDPIKVRIKRLPLRGGNMRLVIERQGGTTSRHDFETQDVLDLSPQMREAISLEVPSGRRAQFMHDLRKVVARMIRMEEDADIAEREDRRIDF